MTMKTIKVAEATNTQLDWLVAKCEGHDFAGVYGRGTDVNHKQFLRDAEGEPGGLK